MSSDEEARSGRGKVFIHHPVQLKTYPARQAFVMCLT
jgi:hypothetical protein